MNWRSSLSTALLSAFILIAVFAARPDANSAFAPNDFVIFYCAGHAVEGGQNPYTAQPLGGCEHQHWPPGMLTGVSEPTALPGFALLPFMLLALAPFAIAKWLWLLASTLAFGLAVAAGARLSSLSPIAVFALLFVPLAMLNVSVGQVTVFTIAAVFLSAICLREGRAKLGAVCALGTLFQPHIALPLLAGLIVLVPRTRAVLFMSLAALAVVHVAVLGVSPSISYFSGVLPAMSRAEFIASDQYGTMWWLHAAGVEATLAARVADAAYVLAIGGGIALTAVMMRRYADAALASVLPVAVALPFAPYLHDIELGVALGVPLVMLRAMPRDRSWNAIAVLCATPWYGALHSAGLAVKCLLGTAVFLAFSTRAKERVVWLGAAACAIAIVFAFRHPFPTGAELTSGAPLDAGALAAESWGRYLAAIPWMHALGPQVVIPKLVSWLAMLAIPVVISRPR